jgi:hypothetical protein
MHRPSWPSQCNLRLLTGAPLAGWLKLRTTIRILTLNIIFLSSSKLLPFLEILPQPR